MRASALLALAAFLSTASALYRGFNYLPTFTNLTSKGLPDFQDEFTAARNLIGTSGFTSARLYTMIQGGTINSPTTAIQAAINTNTTLLLGISASSGQDKIKSELTALESAVSQYESAFTSLIIGVSVGCEDLYRNSPAGVQNNAGSGAEPSDIVDYIGQVRSALSAAGISTPVGHVDTWNAWVNSSNDEVIKNCDFIGMDSYPYFESDLDNSIQNANSTFWDSYQSTVRVAGSKPVWITEMSWPLSGATVGQAVASVVNAQFFWRQVACVAFDQVNTWWFTFHDVDPVTPHTSFGVVGYPVSNKPLFNLSCNGTIPKLLSSSGGPSRTSTSSTATSKTHSHPTSTGRATFQSSTPTPTGNSAISIQFEGMILYAMAGIMAFL